MRNKIVKEAFRPGCRDIWNAFLCEGALYDKYDIPFCPTTAKCLPNEILTWEEVKTLHNKYFKQNPNYKIDAFICFYLDDYKFDNTNGIWMEPLKLLEVSKHFSGVITPDFSTCQDFPIPIKLYATYRMRAIGYWLGENGIPIINNVRWGTEESYCYCFRGIPQNSIVCIGTVGGSPHRLCDRKRFENGLLEMVAVLKPHTIITYGSANYPCLKQLEQQGIRIISFQSKTAKAFSGGARDE